MTFRIDLYMPVDLAKDKVIEKLTIENNFLNGSKQ